MYHTVNINKDLLLDDETKGLNSSMVHVRVHVDLLMHRSRSNGSSSRRITASLHIHESGMVSTTARTFPVRSTGRASAIITGATGTAGGSAISSAAGKS